MDGSTVRAGLASGAVAAVAAALVQLPLHSPADVLFNAGTVTVGALATGVVAGVLVDRVRRRGGGLRLFYAAWAAAFAAVALAAVVMESQLDRSISYVVPLGAIVLGTTGALTPLLAGSNIVRSWLVVLAVVVVAIAVGAGLAGEGDTESGRLELPPRQSSR